MALLSEGQYNEAEKLFAQVMEMGVRVLRDERPGDDECVSRKDGIS